MKLPPTGDRDQVDPAGESGFLRIPEPVAFIVLFDQEKNVLGIGLFKTTEIDERPFLVVVEFDGGAIVHHPEPDGKGGVRNRAALVGIDPAERSSQHCNGRVVCRRCTGITGGAEVLELEVHFWGDLRGKIRRMGGRGEGEDGKMGVVEGNV
jgi:hypothetical protein